MAKAPIAAAAAPASSEAGATTAESVSQDTCFAVGPRGEILTAFHVVKEARPGGIFVRFEGGKELEAQIVKLSEINDLALLRVDQPTPHYLTLTSSNTAAVGSRVFTVGYPVYGPLGTEPKYTEV